MSQLIKKVDAGYQIITFDGSQNKEIIPADSLIPMGHWSGFPNNFISRIVKRPGIQEAEVENESDLHKSALQHVKGGPFFELYLERSTIPSGDNKPQKYSVSAEAQIRLYNWKK